MSNMWYICCVFSVRTYSNSGVLELSIGWSTQIRYGAKFGEARYRAGSSSGDPRLRKTKVLLSCEKKTDYNNFFKCIFPVYSFFYSTRKKHAGIGRADRRDAARRRHTAELTSRKRHLRICTEHFAYLRVDAETCKADIETPRQAYVGNRMKVISRQV